MFCLPRLFVLENNILLLKYFWYILFSTIIISLKIANKLRISLTWTGNTFTATSSSLKVAFQTAPNLPLALISINWIGLVSKKGEEGFGKGLGSDVGN